VANIPEPTVQAGGRTGRLFPRLRQRERPTDPILYNRDRFMGVLRPLPWQPERMFWARIPGCGSV